MASELTKAVPDEAFTRALARERSQSAMTLARLRLIGISVVFALTLLLRYVLEKEDWGGAVLVFGLYWALSAITTAIVWYMPAAARWSGLSMAVVDVPMLFWAQSRMFADSNPAGIAGFTVGIFATIIAVSALSLEGVAILATWLSSVVFIAILMSMANQQPAITVFAAVVLGVTAGASSRLVKRLRFLVHSVAQEELKREKLGRYFSPAVADRLANLKTRASR